MSKWSLLPEGKIVYKSAQFKVPEEAVGSIWRCGVLLSGFLVGEEDTACALSLPLAGSRVDLYVSEGAEWAPCSGWGQPGHLSQVRRGFRMVFPGREAPGVGLCLWAEFRAVLLAFQVG